MTTKPPMGPVSYLTVGENFEHAKVRVAITDDGSGIMAQLTDGSLVEPVHFDCDVTLENGAQFEAHTFYHPLSRHGVCCMPMPDRGNGYELAVRSIDVTGVTNETVVVDLEGAEPGVDEHGNLTERLKNDVNMTYGPGGTVSVDMPEDQLPPGFRRPKQ